MINRWDFSVAQDRIEIRHGFDVVVGGHGRIIGKGG